MECRVCGKQYEGNLCPRCEFPNIEVPGSAEAAEKTIRTMADLHRAAFFEKIMLGVVVYYWKEENGNCVIDKEKRLCFCSLQTLQQGPMWLDQQFARITDIDQISVSAFVEYNDEIHMKNILLPNLHEAKLQEIGIDVDQGHYIVLLLRNGVGTTKSKPVSVFEIL